MLKPQRWSDALIHASNPVMQENTVLLGIEDIVERTLNKTNGSSNPHNMRMTVDLPDPFGPSKPKIEPLVTENET